MGLGLVDFLGCGTSAIRFHGLNFVKLGACGMGWFLGVLAYEDFWMFVELFFCAWWIG